MAPIVAVTLSNEKEWLRRDFRGLLFDGRSVEKRDNRGCPERKNVAEEESMQVWGPLTDIGLRLNEPLGASTWQVASPSVVSAKETLLMLTSGPTGSSHAASDAGVASDTAAEQTGPASQTSSAPASGFPEQINILSTSDTSAVGESRTLTAVPTTATVSSAVTPPIVLELSDDLPEQ